MGRYGIAIRAYNPSRSDSRIHQVAVESDFGQWPAGATLPKEAGARTLCHLRAEGFVVANHDDIDHGPKQRLTCNKCP
jgi:hypothetical protein